MVELNEKKYIEAEILTPLNIGAGEERDWVKGADYLIKTGKIYIINLRKLLQSGVDVSQITACMAKKDSNGLARIIGNKLDSVCDVVFDAPANSDNDIKTFVKNQLSGCPVLTGSSIKGAIRSHILNSLGSNMKDGNDVIGVTKNGENFMRFVKISDIEFEETKLVNTKTFNLIGENGRWTGGWKHGGNNTNKNFKSIGFSTIYESIMPGQKSYGSIMLSPFAFKTLSDKRPQLKKAEEKKNLLDINNLFMTINKQTKSYLEKEKMFFTTFSQAQYAQSIVDSIDNLLDQIPDNGDYCILKMSAGSGFHSITGDWKFDDYANGTLDRKRNGGGAMPKSRKIAIWDDNFTMMGFVRLRIVSEDVLALRERERLQRVQEMTQARAMEEKLLREKMEREEQYNSLISEGRKLEEAGEMERALAKYKEAAELNPEGKLHHAPIKQLGQELEELRRR